MADISLTASMRSNLLSLQQTADLMDQTQERLSTGKKVNSALDNPSSYYTARSLENRAGDLNSLLDSMGQGISTIKAANEGIESITSFVEQAKAVANSARDNAVHEVTSSGKFSETPETKKYTFSLNGKDHTVFSSNTGTKLAEDIQAYLTRATDVDPAGAGITTATAAYSNTTGRITISNGDNDNLETTTIEGYSFKLELTGSSTPVYVDTSAATDAAGFQAAITTALGNLKDADGNAVTGVSVEVSDDGIFSVTSTGSAEVKISGSANGITLDGTAGNSTRTNYMEQYNALLQQITDLAKDSGYKGVNLLQKDNLTVVFNEDRSSNLLITGVDASAEGLNLSPVDNWGTNEGIDKSLDEVDAAISSLRNMASQFGNNYAILQTREEFTENLINVLEEGADKLTLADMNEESANMLALQTRQQLAVNSLSLASQAAQSILQLFS